MPVGLFQSSPIPDNQSLGPNAQYYFQQAPGYLLYALAEVESSMKQHLTDSINLFETVLSLPLLQDPGSSLLLNGYPQVWIAHLQPVVFHGFQEHGAACFVNEEAFLQFHREI